MSVALLLVFVADAVDIDLYNVYDFVWLVVALVMLLVCVQVVYVGVVFGTCALALIFSFTGKAYTCDEPGFYFVATIYILRCQARL